jgi:hypothetical protein
MKTVAILETKFRPFHFQRSIVLIIGQRAHHRHRLCRHVRRDVNRRRLKVVRATILSVVCAAVIVIVVVVEVDHLYVVVVVVGVRFHDLREVIDVPEICCPRVLTIAKTARTRADLLYVSTVARRRASRFPETPCVLESALGRHALGAVGHRVVAYSSMSLYESKN